MNQRRTEAQVSAGKLRIQQEQRLDGARRELRAAAAAVRDDRWIRVELPGTAVPAGRTVLDVGGLVVRGAERIALLGGNGTGKTTLLRGRRPAVPTGALPQRLDVVDDDRSVLDNVLDSVERLTEALLACRGAVVVASHDLPFLRGIGCARWWRVEGRLHEVAGPEGRA